MASNQSVVAIVDAAYILWDMLSQDKHLLMLQYRINT